MRTHLLPVICPVPGCPRRTAEQRDMRRHVKVHLPRERDYRCPFEHDKPATFLREDHLQRHVERLHKRELEHESAK